MYADEDEVREMELCHENSVRMLRGFLDRLDFLGSERAIEVAAGDGRVSRDLLKDYFEAIDCFDQCSLAVKTLEKLR